MHHHKMYSSVLPIFKLNWLTILKTIKLDLYLKPYTKIDLITLQLISICLLL